MNRSLVRTIPGERFTPYTLALKLQAKVLLESASFVKGRERYSIMLLREAFAIFERGGTIYMKRDGKDFAVKSKGRDILDILLYFANQHSEETFPFPFPAGGIGYLAYEYATKFDTVHLRAKNDELGLPIACFLFGHVFLVFDHYTDSISIVGTNYREHEIDLQQAVDSTVERINDLDFNFMSASDEPVAAVTVESAERGRYEQGVATVREEIIKGNLLQGVLSRRLAITTGIKALDAYRALRSTNPSPYMFFMDFGTFQLFGASPEVHVKVREDRVIIRPIAGTRKRGETVEEDRQLERDLLADEKEKAEHLMLVDLARNDIGRICTPGSVQVTESMIIERYSHVMHIVSQVEGRLEDGKNGLDAVRATFPAGTVTGAPKIKAMEIVDGLEPDIRGFYAGVIGYVEAGGSLDSCIAIRCAVKRGDLLVLQAGAGIVYDSVPEREFEETSNKLQALATAVGIEV